MQTKNVPILFENKIFFFFLLTARRPTEYFFIMTKGITLSQLHFFTAHHSKKTTLCIYTTEQLFLYGVRHTVCESQ
jgi:hypothetical protein